MARRWRNFWIGGTRLYFAVFSPQSGTVQRSAATFAPPPEERKEAQGIRRRVVVVLLLALSFRIDPRHKFTSWAGTIEDNCSTLLKPGSTPFGLPPHQECSMSDILSRSERSASIVADKSIEPWQRAWQGLEAWSGLVLSDLSESARQIVDVELGPVSGILADYDLKTWDDYAGIDEADIDEMLKRIATATQALVDSEVGRVMTGLRTAESRLPTAEIADVRQHKLLFIPLLVEAIEKAVAAVRAASEPDGETHFFAAFLLTEFEVQAAFPILLEGFLLRGDGVDGLFGDAIDQLFPAALALFLRNDTDQIDEILHNTSLDMYVRWAALNAYVYLVRDGVMTRDVAVAKLDSHLVQCMDRRDHEFIEPLICTLNDFVAEEALGTIREAFKKNLVDTSIVDLDSVESWIAQGVDVFQHILQRCRPTGMPDTIAELSGWAAFSEQPPRVSKTPVPQDQLPQPKLPRPDFARPQPVTSIRSDVKVGRNDPCPCGSGQKFKKCCR